MDVRPATGQDSACYYKEVFYANEGTFLEFASCDPPFAAVAVDPGRDLVGPLSKMKPLKFAMTNYDVQGTYFQKSLTVGKDAFISISQVVGACGLFDLSLFETAHHTLEIDINIAPQPFWIFVDGVQPLAGGVVNVVRASQGVTRIPAAAFHFAAKIPGIWYATFDTGLPYSDDIFVEVDYGTFGSQVALYPPTGEQGDCFNEYNTEVTYPRPR